MNLATRIAVMALGGALSAPWAPWARAADDEDLAKQLSNPVAALISVPFQYNYDHDIGVGRQGRKNYINFQPVIPVTLNTDWNVISRTILPLIAQNDVFENGERQSGIGDVLQSFFFSPSKPTTSGMIWGLGPVVLIPTASDDLLGGEKWGLGPTGVVLKQDGPWTFGMLANHIWSVGGSSDRSSINSTYLQPFMSYTTKDAWTYTLNTESTYDWERKQWSVPVNAIISKLFKVGNQPVSVGAGVRYWVYSPDGGAHGWGARVVLTLLFPK